VKELKGRSLEAGAHLAALGPISCNSFGRSGGIDCGVRPDALTLGRRLRGRERCDVCFWR
jgi:hypothetical protein